MEEFKSERDRRIAQFADYLKLMFRRAHLEGHGCCFIILSESRRPGTGRGSSRKAEARIPAAMAVRCVPTPGPAGAGSEGAGDEHLVREGWREGSGERFVQFSFERQWFCLDMPRQTLSRTEASRVIRDKSGFFYLKDRPEFTLTGEHPERYDPFRKVYLYGDEGTAARDLAFIFFEVWEFPADWRFYVTAAAFSGLARFEQDLGIE